MQKRKKMGKERQIAKRVLTIMRGLEKQYPEGAIPREAVVATARKKQIPPKQLLDAIILLKSEGYIYSTGKRRLKVTG